MLCRQLGVLPSTVASGKQSWCSRTQGSSALADSGVQAYTGAPSWRPNLIMIVWQVHSLTCLPAAALLLLQVTKALIDMENMFELLATEPRVQDDPHAATLQLSSGAVEFKQVVFSYNPSASVPPVLRGLSFLAPGGRSLAVVGSTGSGKSTLLRCVRAAWTCGNHWSLWLRPALCLQWSFTGGTC